MHLSQFTGALGYSVTFENMYKTLLSNFQLSLSIRGQIYLIEQKSDLAKLQNTGPLLKLYKLSWLGGSSVVSKDILFSWLGGSAVKTTDEPLSRRAT